MTLLISIALMAAVVVPLVTWCFIEDRRRRAGREQKQEMR